MTEIENESTEDTYTNIWFEGSHLSGRFTTLAHISKFSRNTPKKIASNKWLLDLVFPSTGKKTTVAYAEGHSVSRLPYHVYPSEIRPHEYDLIIKHISVADIIIFTANSRLLDANIICLSHLLENLEYLGKKNIPIVFQLNKRDLDHVYSVEEMKKHLKSENCYYIETVAHNKEDIIKLLRLTNNILK